MLRKGREPGNEATLLVETQVAVNEVPLTVVSSSVTVVSSGSVGGWGGGEMG